MAPALSRWPNSDSHVMATESQQDYADRTSYCKAHRSMGPKSRLCSLKKDALNGAAPPVDRAVPGRGARRTECSLQNGQVLDGAVLAKA